MNKLRLLLMRLTDVILKDTKKVKKYMFIVNLLLIFVFTWCKMNCREI